MAYAGKFIDRNPFLCAAGYSRPLDQPVGTLFKHYPIEDNFEIILNEHIAKTKCPDTIAKDPPRKYVPRESAEVCISPPEKSKFQEFYNRVYEARYKSLLERPLGMCRQGFTKPDSVNNDTTRFGRKSTMGEALYDIVLPKKIPYQVLLEDAEGHEKYIVSHKRYFPAERINRKYDSPSFNGSHTFGMLSNKQAGGVRRALEDISFPDFMCISSSVQRDFLERVKSPLGKPLQPNKIQSKLPENFTFGIPTKLDRYTGEELLYYRDPCDARNRLHQALAYLNRIRNCLKKRKGYDLEDMRWEFEEMDKDYTGVLDLEAFVCSMKDHSLEIDVESLRLLLNHFNMLQDGDKVKIQDFLTLIDCRAPVPDLGRLDDIFLPDASTLTTYRDFAHAVYKNDPQCRSEPAGMPSQSVERSLPKVAGGGIRADIDNLSEETDVRALLMPSICSTYGLSHRDYLLPRTKDTIRSVFSNIGYDLQDDKFEELWAKALDHWTCRNGMVSVEAFRYTLEEMKE